MIFLRKVWISEDKNRAAPPRGGVEATTLLGTTMLQCFADLTFCSVAQLSFEFRWWFLQYSWRVNDFRSFFDAVLTRSRYAIGIFRVRFSWFFVEIRDFEQFSWTQASFLTYFLKRSRHVNAESCRNILHIILYFVFRQKQRSLSVFGIQTCFCWQVEAEVVLLM